MIFYREIKDWRKLERIRYILNDSDENGDDDDDKALAVAANDIDTCLIIY